MKGESPPLQAVPLQMVTPRKEQGSSDRLRVGSNSTQGFRVPDDWIVEEKSRVNCPTDPGRVDKYYIEPKTGKKFRSVPAVKRYLMDGNTDMSTSEVSKEVGDHSDMQVSPFITRSKSQFALPDGWRIEEKRRSSGAYPGMVDKSYIEPKTGQKFRSMTAVKRYLMDGKTDMLAPPVLKEAGDKSDVQIFPLTTSHSSDFVLPDGWRIEEKRRDGGIHPGKIDKYYIEPGTGKKFCSAMAVKRHLSNGSTNTSTPAALRKGRDKRAASLQQMLITPFTAGKMSKFILPDGWIIEERKRSNAFVIDKYYVEQETGQRFRSLIAVERYLREKEEKEFARPLNTFKRSNRHHLSRRSGSKRKNVSGKKHSLKVVIKCPKKSEDNTTVPKEVTPDRDPTFSEHSDTPEKSKSREKAEDSMDDFAPPPSTINWVLAGPGGDMWSPFVGESIVPESIKQNWKTKSDKVARRPLTSLSANFPVRWSLVKHLTCEWPVKVCVGLTRGQLRQRRSGLQDELREKSFVTEEVKNVDRLEFSPVDSECVHVLAVDDSLVDCKVIEHFLLTLYKKKIWLEYAVTAKEVEGGICNSSDCTRRSH